MIATQGIGDEILRRLYCVALKIPQDLNTNLLCDNTQIPGSQILR